MPAKIRSLPKARRKGGRAVARKRFTLRVPAPLPLAALAGFFVGTASVVMPALETQAGVAPVTAWTQPLVPTPVVGVQTNAALGACTAVDGDTLRCGSERVRLIGIDTPEMPGHCREGRDCVEGDPFAAKAALAAALGQGMTIQRYGTDTYGRTLALVSGRGGDLSCQQLRAGYAIYRADWDIDGAMKRVCG